MGPVDGLHWEVGRVRQEVVVLGGRVDDDVESRCHLAADHHAEGGDHGVDVGGVLPARLQHQVLAHHHPVEVGQGEVGLDVEDDVLAHGDLLVGGPHVDVAVVGGVGSVGRRLRVGAATLKIISKILRPIKCWELFGEKSWPLSKFHG